MIKTIKGLEEVIFILNDIAITYQFAMEAAVQHLEENDYPKALNVLQKAESSANKAFLDAVTESCLEYAKSEMA